MSDFRVANGRKSDWIRTSIGSGFSNFIHVDTHNRSNTVLRRIFSLARKLNFQSLLTEEIAESDCALLAEENETMARRDPDFRSSKVKRLTFWRTPPNVQPAKDDFLGYVIFKSDYFGNEGRQQDHIYEAVMRSPRRPRENNFTHCQRQFEVRTIVGTYQVPGVLYAQQNGKTNVCAHVALRTALTCFPQIGDVSYQRINEILGIDHHKRRIGDGAGIDPHEIEFVATGLGLSCLKDIHEPNHPEPSHSPREFQSDLFASIQSGFPALLAFELDGRQTRHVIPVFGHTFNEDTWVPEADRRYFGSTLEYYPASNWVSTFLIHDDNFGPYYCLPRHYLQKAQFRAYLGFSTKESEVTEAFPAEILALGYLKNIASVVKRIGDGWYDRFGVFARTGQLVLRTTLVSRHEYVAHLRLLTGWNFDHPVEEDYIAQVASTFPDSFWMVEASGQELYPASRRKFGEVLIRNDPAMDQRSDWSLFLGARLPGRFFMKQPDKRTYIGDGVLPGCHTQLYRAETPESEGNRSR